MNNPIVSMNDTMTIILEITNVVLYLIQLSMIIKESSIQENIRGNGAKYPCEGMHLSLARFNLKPFSQI